MSTNPKYIGPRGREMEYLIHQYKMAHPEKDPDYIEPHLVAEWACKKRMWDRPPVSPEERLRRELARHLCGEHTRDPQGSTVRKHHAVIYTIETPDGPKRRSRWYEINQAPVKHMQASLQLRRRAALADVVQLSFDFESYNENNIHGERLPEMDFDFNKDLEEIKLPTDYPSEPPETDDDGDGV